ncbi:uncharacterized protein LOC144785322 isoform X2 [Lissotriton helveticus]
MEGACEPHELLSGFLSKRRQTLKFQWRCYFCILTNAALSYYKVTPETDEKGILWGSIAIKVMQSVRAVPKITQYYPLEVVLESGKIVLLAAHNKEDQNKWLQAIWKAMVMSGQEETLCRNTPEGFSYSEGLFTLKSDSMTESCRPEGSPGDADISGLLLNDDVTEDMDSFIDRTFDGISFNRQSMMGRQSHLHDSRIEVEKEAS